MAIGSIGEHAHLSHQMHLKTIRQEMYKQMDQNSDGAISKGELQTLAREITPPNGAAIDVDQVFAGLNTNQDEVIDASEYDAAMDKFEHRLRCLARAFGPPPGPPPADAAANPLQALFQQMDQDGDGIISKTEFQTTMQQFADATGSSIDMDQLFTALDSDQDGVITSSEQDTVLQQLAASSGPPKGPPPGPPPADNSTDPLLALFQQMDQDGDGSISQSEFQTAMQQLTHAGASATTAAPAQTAAAESASLTNLAPDKAAFLQKLLRDIIQLASRDSSRPDSDNSTRVQTYA